MKSENFVPAAVIAVGLIISAMFGRYEFHHEGLSTFRIDKLTGKIEFCGLEKTKKWCP